MKRIIKLNESDLHKIVKESVRNIMKDYATSPSNEEIAFFKFIHNGNVTPIQCSKAGVDYDLLMKYHSLMRHCYVDGSEDPTPLENEIKKQFITNYRRLQKQGWLKEHFTIKRRSVEDFGEPTPELDTTAFKNELTKLVKYLGMAQGNFKGIQSCIKMITQISNELKQHSEDTDFNVKRMLQGLEQAAKQLSNGQTQPAVKIVNQIIMEVDRTVNAIKARPNKWNGGIMAESNLHKIVKESVNRILNEVGDTKRGQYMLGRLKNRQSNGGGKFARGINYNDAGDYAHKANGNSYSDDYQQGYEDEEKYGRNANSTWDGDKYRRMKFNYDTKQMEDMDNIGKRFIDFIEKHDGGVLMQTIVDYESGNQTGKPQSPLGEIVPYFEENVLGYECTPEMKKAIKDAYNQWWFYAQDQLMPDEEH